MGRPWVCIAPCGRRRPLVAHLNLPFVFLLCSAHALVTSCSSFTDYDGTPLSFLSAPTESPFRCCSAPTSPTLAFVSFLVWACVAARPVLCRVGTWTEQAGVGLLLGEQKDSAIVSVKQVVPRGSADRTGRIRVGDQVPLSRSPSLALLLPRFQIFRSLCFPPRASSIPVSVCVSLGIALLDCVVPARSPSSAATSEGFDGGGDSRLLPD